ncbi:MAG: hypothetical protein IJ560_00945 [Alphaproteobacteria bacterium]|nr:hypothetical protein [Alphaproteobacteria bacterium]
MRRLFCIITLLAIMPLASYADLASRGYADQQDPQNVKHGSCRLVYNGKDGTYAWGRRRNRRRVERIKGVHDESFKFASIEQ